MIYSITKSGIPNVTKVFIVYGKDPGFGFIDTMTNLGFEIIFSNHVMKNRVRFNAVVDRYEDCLQYLKEHEGEYDRVAITDFRDVVFFADGFSTVGFDEVVMTTECVKHNSIEEIECIDFSHDSNYRWIVQTFGNEIANKYREEKRVVINAGVIIGGYSQVKQLLTKFNETVYSFQSTSHLWGFDQAVFNYLYYSGQLKDINLVLDSGTQRIAFDCFGGHVYNMKKKSFHLKYNDCSMVIRHKMYGAGYWLNIV